MNFFYCIGKKALQKHNIDLIIAATAIEAGATLYFAAFWWIR
jgi:predicted nucleic acid-binding protein